VPGLAVANAEVRQQLADARLAYRAYTREHGEDHPDVTGWRWSSDAGAGS